MKKIVVLLLVALGIFGFGAMTMGEDTGANFYLDYSFMNVTPNPDINQTNCLTLGADYNKDFLLGAFYTTTLSYSPAPPAGVSHTDNGYFIYGGYNVVQGDASLGIIVSYLSMFSGVSGLKSGQISSTASSLGIGIKEAVNFEGGNVSILYSYGISNKLNDSISGDYPGTVNISILEVKGVYYFSESIGWHLVYRSIPLTTSGKSGSGSYSGIGIGVDFKF